MAKSKNKIYLVETKPGTYRSFTDWPSCQAFVHGKPFAYAGGKDRAEALAKIKKAKSWKDRRGYLKAPSQVSASNLNRPKKFSRKPPDYPTAGLTSDAGTHGNPGPCEYQVTDIEGRVLEHKHLGVHSNNYAELAGIAAMIPWAVRRGETTLWTDSSIAMIWIKSGKLGPDVREPEKIMAMIHGIREQLLKHPQLKLEKWITKRWGQIPSDFGRK